MRGLQLAKTAELQLKECCSSVEQLSCEGSLQAIEKIFKDKLQSPSLFVVWQIHKITWGKYEGGQIKLHGETELNPNHWLEFRAFNEQEEIHFKRKGNSFSGRYIRDEIGEGTYYIDSFSRLWGEETGSDDGYIHLLDRERKIYMEVPCTEVGAGWYGLLTRNYVGSDEKIGLSGYVDYRFVAIEPAKDGD